MNPATCSHVWTRWRPVPDVTDMLARKCHKCGTREIRVLPPNVRPEVLTQWKEEEEGQ